MFNIIKLSLLSLLTTLLLSLFNTAFAVFENSTEGADVAVCSTTANMMTNNGDCRTTPTKYETSVFEMGVCTSHPFTNDGTKTDISTMDKSTCSVTFSATDQTNGSVIDIATSIGGSIDLVGTSTRPANGTYGFPYIVLREKFRVGISIVGFDGNTYNGDASNTVASGGTLADYDDNLRNFTGGVAKCQSGYVGATIPIGTIDAFLTNSSLERSETTGGAHYAGGSDTCVKVGRLVGVINLSKPFKITPSTLKMQFNFIVTDYGINMTDNNNDGYPNQYGSAPFSGTFTITEAPAQ
jgi:hypothetical protein